MITFGQMQADTRHIAIYFRRKAGIKLSDSGLGDAVLRRGEFQRELFDLSKDKC
jgi:Family of unknown function (DUF5923)